MTLVSHMVLFSHEKERLTWRTNSLKNVNGPRRNKISVAYEASRSCDPTKKGNLFATNSKGKGGVSASKKMKPFQVFADFPK